MTSSSHRTDPGRLPGFWPLAAILCTLVLQFPAAGLAQAPAAVTENKDKDEPLRLSPFVVNASSDEDGYLTKLSNSAGRVAQDYLNTTQTISVLNSTYINDLNIQDTRRLFDSLPNTYQGSLDQSSRVWVRGAEINSIYVDGVLASQQAAMPLQFYDRVELVSGPSSASFGVGQPGGIINFITKAPTGRSNTTIETGYGEFKNYLVNLDSEGKLPSSQLGTVSYRAVGFWERGNFQIQNESHRGTGAQLSLRDNLNSTTDLYFTLQYAKTEFPLSDQPFVLYSNQVAYTWLEAVTDAAHGGLPFIPTLPNSRPYPAGGSTSGDWAGGTLLPQGTNAGPSNYGGDVHEQFRASFVMEKSFLDNALTIRNTGTVSTESRDGQYFSWAGGYYVDPKTGVPFNQEGPALPYPNNVYGPVSDIAIIPVAIEVVGSSIGRSDNLDAVYKKQLSWVNLQVSLGGNISNSSANAPAQIQYNLTRPDGSPLYLFINQSTPIDIYQHPSTNLSASSSRSYAWGGYVNGSFGFLKDRLTVELGNRRDAGGNSSRDLLHNTSTSSGTYHSKGAPRESIRIKPLPWLSFYALRAEHDDPPQLVGKYALFTPGPNLAAVNAKYHNFTDNFEYVPTGVLKEVGVKAELLGGNIVFSADYFKFQTAGGILTNIISDNDPTSATYGSTVVQRVVSANNASGGEIQLAGKVNKHLTFTAAYGITRGQYSTGTLIDPPTTTMLHAKYNTDVSHGVNLYVMAGVTRWGPFWLSQGPFVRYDNPQYLWDGGIGAKWDHGHQSIEISEDNIGGKIPFVSPQTAYSAGGSLRQWFIKYKFKFF